MGLPARLFGPALVATGPATVYTCPAGNLVRLVIWVTNTSATAATFTASIGADAVSTRVIAAQSIPGNSTVQFGPPFVMSAGETIQLSAGTNNVLNASGHGERILVG